METPVSRYRVSERCYPETLAEIEYSLSDLVRKVQSKGEIYLHGKSYLVSKGFRGERIGLRGTSRDGLWDVYYCPHLVGHLDERASCGSAFGLPTSARCARSVRQAKGGDQELEN